MTIATTIDQLRDILASHRDSVEGFQTHLTLAKNFTQDERILAFIDHTLEEEAERLTLLSQLSNQLGNLASRPMPDAAAVLPPAAMAAEAEGHYRLRDQRELTVGSLYGSGQ